jgi:hypothetical protein
MLPPWRPGSIEWGRRCPETATPMALESQRTGDGTAARVHLDIETDDVRAEVARVLALGATVLETATPSPGRSDTIGG